MAYHFLSVLGTGLYEPVCYQDKDFTSKEQEYVQLAVIEKYSNLLREDDARITIFLTNKAKKSNYENKVIDPFIKEKMDKWNNPNVLTDVGYEKPGLEKQFKEQFKELEAKLNPVDIEDPSNEGAIWELFQKINGELRENDQIIFDITHSFRSIPMLALIVINYAKVLKKCELFYLCYGAYEPSLPRKNGIKKAPLADLTLYNDILEWTNAANVFMKYGNAALMNQLVDDKIKSAPLDKKKEVKEKLNSVRQVASAAQNLSDTIMTSRGIGSDSLKKKNSKEYSIQGAVQNYRKQVANMSGEKEKDVFPIYPLIQKTQEAFTDLNQSENYKTGLAVAKWCLDHGMVQQGYTALEETAITYLCNLYGVDESNIDSREEVSEAVSAMGVYAHIKAKAGETCYFQNLKERKEFIENVYAPKHKGKDITLARKVIENLDTQWLKQISLLKDNRNDINHFGMRADPKTPKNLEKQLKQLIAQIEALEKKNAILYEGFFLDNEETETLFQSVRGDVPYPLKPSDYHVTSEYNMPVLHPELYGTKVTIHVINYKRDESLINAAGAPAANEGFSVEINSDHDSVQEIIDRVTASGKNWHITGSYMNEDDAVLTNYIDFSDGEPVDVYLEAVFAGWSMDNTVFRSPAYVTPAYSMSE